MYCRLDLDDQKYTIIRVKKIRGRQGCSLKTEPSPSLIYRKIELIILNYIFLVEKSFIGLWFEYAQDSILYIIMDILRTSCDFKLIF